MEKLVLEEQKNTPQIEFDPERSQFKMTGRSFPENSRKFFNPIIEWFDSYTPAPGTNAEFHFSFYYISSSSIISLMELMRKIDKMNGNSVNFSIFWHYDDDDDDIKKIGEDYKNLVSIPFKLISNG